MTIVASTGLIPALTGSAPGTVTSSGLASLVASSVNIDLDETFVIQSLLFMALIVALKPLLFEPLLKVFEERERRTDGAREEAREMQRKAGELLRQYESELQRVNHAAQEERDKIRTETTRLEAQILAEARDATAKIIESGRKDIEAQIQKIRFDLGQKSERLATEIAEQVVGRSLS